MTKRDYYHEADAPTATRLVVAATAFVQDDEQRVLLVRRGDNDVWALPGGQQEIGETTEQCVERETAEETGYEVRVSDLLAVFSDPAHVIAYADGEVRQEFVVLYRAAVVGGGLRPSLETPRIVWAHESELEAYELRPWIRVRLDRGFGAASDA